jgi:hypothetical protein
LRLSRSSGNKKPTTVSSRGFLSKSFLTLDKPPRRRQLRRRPAKFAEPVSFVARKLAMVMRGVKRGFLVMGQIEFGTQELGKQLDGAEQFKPFAETSGQSYKGSCVVGDGCPLSSSVWE